MDKKIILLAIAGIGLYLYSRKSQASTELIIPDSSGSMLDTIGNDIMSTITGSTRGERNNNPGNIRKGPAWQGLTPDQPDNAFATFSTPEYGIRALGTLLRNYYHSGLNTVRLIINKYAPSTENNTNAYISAVANGIGAGADEPLNLDDNNTLAALVSAIITHENGRNIYASTGQIDAGIAMVA